MIFNSKLILFFRWTLHSFKKMILCDINILNLTLVSGINISPDLVILRIFQILVSPIIELIQICKITKHLFWSKNKVFLAIFCVSPQLLLKKVSQSPLVADSRYLLRSIHHFFFFLFILTTPSPCFLSINPILN